MQAGSATPPKVTLDVYGHLFPDEEDRTRDAIDLVFGATPDHTDDSAAAQ